MRRDHLQEKLKLRGLAAKGAPFGAWTAVREKRGEMCSDAARAEIEVKRYHRDLSLIRRARHLGLPQLEIYCPSEKQVVLGRGSDPAKELNQEAVNHDCIPVFRRSGGGCAVLIDDGNVIVSLAGSFSGIAACRWLLDKMTEWLASGLRMLGLDGVFPSGISDLSLEGRKVSGSCLRRERDFFYYSACIMVDSDPFLLERYLAHPPREPEYRRGRNHSDFVSCLRCERYPDAESLRVGLHEVLEIPAFLSCQETVSEE